MPFREKVKKVFGRSNSSSSSSNASSASSLNQVQLRGIGDPKVYQPGEIMPRPKYRAPVDKKHKEKLDAFSFGDSWRPRSNSITSGCSPMGSRPPSRRPSFSGKHRSEWAAVSEALEADGAFDSASEKKKHNNTDDVHQEYATDTTSHAAQHSPFSQSDLDDALTRQKARVTIPVGA